MRSTFGSFNTATSGLFASQRSLDVTSHNISNANTVGYSRQKTLQRASMPIYENTSGVIGTGVETYDIIRMRSNYLDQKFWGQNKTYCEWSVKQGQLEQVESIFNEPSETGIRVVMDDFFLALEELSKKSGDATCRAAVAEKANTLTTTINRCGQEIINAIRDANFAVKSKVDEINSLSEQIANLNKQIFNFELGGHKANDLRDRRNVLLDQLSSIVNINVSEIPGPNGNSYTDVKIGGMTLINHTTYNKITTQDEDKNYDADGNYIGITDMGGGKISKVVWDGAQDQEVKIQSGELKGLLEMRDGNESGDSNNRGLPYYLSRLNEFAVGFTTSFNAQHRQGKDFEGNQGGNFFYEPASINDLNCINFKVDSDIAANYNKIASSSMNNGESNNENIELLIELRNNKGMFSSLKGTPDDYLKSILSILAVDSSQTERMATNAQSLVFQTDNSRLSESGVSLDEEMANMVKFQQAYNASARMVTTLDKILDTTVNRLGIVGR
jgi:flagellar hook-associated protein 1